MIRRLDMALNTSTTCSGRRSLRARVGIRGFAMRSNLTVVTRLRDRASSVLRLDLKIASRIDSLTAIHYNVEHPDCVNGLGHTGDEIPCRALG